jgi:AraC-like DNA-binding protein
MAGMCGNGQCVPAPLTVAASRRILPVCIEPWPRMTDVYAGSFPVSKSIEVTSADLEEARDLLNRFYYPIVVGTPEGAGGFTLDLGVIQLGPLTVGHLALGTATTLHASELDSYHVTLPTAGTVYTRQHRAEVVADPGQAAIFRPGQPVFTSHLPGMSELDIKIERSALEAELAAQLGRPAPGALDLAPAMSLADGPGRSWARFVRMVYDELGNTDSLVHHPMIGEQLRQSVIGGLLLSVRHRYHDELLEPPAPAPPRVLRRVLDAIHDEPERAFTAAGLAEIGGMSVRSLQEGFRRHVGSAPMTYLQSVRLDRAHESLRRADPAQVTVSAVAHRWGFAHLGRFASAYRLRFGQTPSETLRAG